jgi:hypothetical protein
MKSIYSSFIFTLKAILENEDNARMHIELPEMNNRLDEDFGSLIDNLSTRQLGVTVNVMVVLSN